jgi:ABC-type uncharacterized transport system ATPase subunit
MTGINHLTKTYGDKTAVDPYSHRAARRRDRRPQPNGAGRPTTMRLIPGLDRLSPTCRRPR